MKKSKKKPIKNYIRFYKKKLNRRLEKITYARVKFLRPFLTQQGKILPSRITGLKIQQQKKIAKAIKRARIVAILPFVNSNPDF